MPFQLSAAAIVLSDNKGQLAEAKEACKNKVMQPMYRMTLKPGSIQLIVSDLNWSLCKPTIKKMSHHSYGFKI
jgi:hypothetical protein